ncbi:hypothetical protein EGW03_02790 [bacterium]|nr:hypothetical protein [bacterium]
MEEQIIELIKVIEKTINNDNIILNCTVISCVIALLSLLISLIIFWLQIKDRILRKKVLGYIYKYFAPTYITDTLPTTNMIEQDLKSIFFSEKEIFDTLIYLNKENFINAVGDASTILSEVKWKPNMVYD